MLAVVFAVFAFAAEEDVNSDREKTITLKYADQNISFWHTVPMQEKNLYYFFCGTPKGSRVAWGVDVGTEMTPLVRAVDYDTPTVSNVGWVPQTWIASTWQPKPDKKHEFAHWSDGSLLRAFEVGSQDCTTGTPMRVEILGYLDESKWDVFGPHSSITGPTLLVQNADDPDEIVTGDLYDAVDEEQAEALAAWGGGTLVANGTLATAAAQETHQKYLDIKDEVAAEAEEEDAGYSDEEADEEV